MPAAIEDPQARLARLIALVDKLHALREELFGLDPADQKAAWELAKQKADAKSDTDSAAALEVARLTGEAITTANSDEQNEIDRLAAWLGVKS